MTITRLQYFVEAAKCENFTQAARNLYIAQPNLSRQISLGGTGSKAFVRPIAPCASPLLAAIYITASGFARHHQGSGADQAMGRAAAGHFDRCWKAGG